MAMVKYHSSLELLDTNYSRLFLSEGIATVIFGVAIWFLLPDCKSILSCAFNL
jgi:hypothetical protein